MTQHLFNRAPYWGAEFVAMELTEPEERPLSVQETAELFIEELERHWDEYREPAGRASIEFARDRRSRRWGRGFTRSDSTGRPDVGFPSPVVTPVREIPAEEVHRPSGAVCVLKSHTLYFGRSSDGRIHLPPATFAELPITNLWM